MRVPVEFDEAVPPGRETWVPVAGTIRPEDTVEAVVGCIALLGPIQPGDRFKVQVVSGSGAFLRFFGSDEFHRTDAFRKVLHVVEPGGCAPPVIVGAKPTVNLCSDCVHHWAAEFRPPRPSYRGQPARQELKTLHPCGMFRDGRRLADARKVCEGTMWALKP